MALRKNTKHEWITFPSIGLSGVVLMGQVSVNACVKVGGNAPVRRELSGVFLLRASNFVWSMIEKRATLPDESGHMTGAKVLLSW